MRWRAACVRALDTARIWRRAEAPHEAHAGSALRAARQSLAAMPGHPIAASRPVRLGAGCWSLYKVGCQQTHSRRCACGCRQAVEPGDSSLACWGENSGRHDKTITGAQRRARSPRRRVQRRCSSRGCELVSFKDVDVQQSKSSSHRCVEAKACTKSSTAGPKAPQQRWLPFA